jgi:hypothetical protein
MVRTPPQTRPDVGGVRGAHQFAPGGKALAGWLGVCAGYALVVGLVTKDASGARDERAAAGYAAGALVALPGATRSCRS